MVNKIINPHQWQDDVIVQAFWESIFVFIKDKSAIK